MNRSTMVQALPLAAGAAIVCVSLARNGSRTSRLVAGIAAGLLTAPAFLSHRPPSRVDAEQRSTLLAPREEVYRAFRRFAEWPTYFPHVEGVEEGAGNRLRWTVRGPAGRRASWDADLAEEWENEQLGWRSVHGSPIEASGTLRLRDAPHGRGTEVKLCLSYASGSALFAPLLSRFAEAELREGLRRFKQNIETGEIATTKGQPSGRQRRTMSSAAHISTPVVAS